MLLVLDPVGNAGLGPAVVLRQDIKKIEPRGVHRTAFDALVMADVICPGATVRVRFSRLDEADDAILLQLWANHLGALATAPRHSRLTGKVLVVEDRAPFQLPGGRYKLYAQTPEGKVFAADVSHFAPPAYYFARGDQVDLELLGVSDEEHMVFGYAMPAKLVGCAWRMLPRGAEVMEGEVSLAEGGLTTVVLGPGLVARLHSKDAELPAGLNLGDRIRCRVDHESLLAAQRCLPQAFMPYQVDAECLAVVAKANAPFDTGSIAALVDATVSRRGGGGVSRVVRSADFRDGVLDAFNSMCAFCGERHVVLQFNAMQGAHVIPKAVGGRDVLANALCLCQLHHWAFDKGLIAIDQAGYACISERVRQASSEEGQILSGVHRKKITIPDGVAPPTIALAWHWQHVFLDSVDQRDKG